MGRPGANAPLLFGLIAIASGSAAAQTLTYDMDALADTGERRKLSYDVGALADVGERLPYRLDQLTTQEIPFDPGLDEGALTILGVNLNDRELPDSTIMAVRGGVAMLPIDDLRRWRLRTNGAGALDIDGQTFAPLTSVPGLTFRVDNGAQMLILAVPVGSFEATSLVADTVTAPSTSPAATVAFVNYDLAFEHVGGSNVASAFLEMGASSGAGLLTNTMLVNGSRREKTLVRLDTYAIHDDPSGLTRLIIGDGLTRGSSWTPQARFGGIRYGTDFSLQPGFLSFPTPVFDGQTSIPSNVEVFVNDVLRYQTEVDQGPFALSQLPLVTGSGQVKLRVNDALGVERTILADYYVSSRLLRAGLSDYSIEAGAERRFYGSRSFDYGSPFAAGTYRYGLTGWLTSEARAELSQDLQMIGGGLATTVGRIGEVGFSLAGSHSDDGTGMLYRVYAQRISPFWSVNASYQSSTRDFAQIGQMGRTDRPREILQLSAGLTMGSWGNVNASESFIRRVDDDKARITTFSYNRRLGRVGNINAFLLNSRATGTPDATTIGLSFSMSLGSNTSLYAQADSDARRIEINKALPSDRGWGYRLYAEDAERDQQAADISYRGRAFEVSGQARRSGGQTGFRMLANGGLLLAGGSVFPTQRLDSGFAIVDVGGQKGVRVFQDNREVTRTNGSGVAVVTQLRPYESNRISVASDDLHLDTSMKNDTIMVVPRPLGGVFARFGISEGRAGTVVIEVADGQPLEPGTPVTIEGDENGTFAGYGGEVFVENIVAGMRLTATRRQGVCSVVLPAAPADETLPRIGPLHCSQAGQ